VGVDEEELERELKPLKKLKINEGKSGLAGKMIQLGRCASHVNPLKGWLENFERSGIASRFSQTPAQQNFQIEISH
jgi:hypothetical protein